MDLSFIDCTALWSFFGVLAGGVTTIFVSRYCYQRASKELRDETEELRTINRMTVEMLERSGSLPPGLKAARDEAGNCTGVLIVQGASTIEGKGSASIQGGAGREGKDETNSPEPPALRRLLNNSSNQEIGQMAKGSPEPLV